MRFEGKLGVAVLALAMSSTLARADEADAILKAMSDYLAAQPTVAANYDSSVEVETTALEKIQFNSSGRIAVQKPNKLHVKRMGGYVHVEMISDGSKLTIYAPNLNVYAQRDVPGTMDELIDGLQEVGLVFPGGDLLLSDVHAALGSGVIEAKHIGLGVINGVECEHLAFRNTEFDWQLWVRSGDKPIPCKYVISSKNVTGAPQYTLTINDWSESTDDTFAFQPPAGATQVEVKALPHLDEIPQGVSK